MLTDISGTISLMTSDNYKERFIAEYYQTKIRYEKLHKMLVNYDANTLDFEPNCPIEILRNQCSHMGTYLYDLEVRAEIEKIEL